MIHKQRVFCQLFHYPKNVKNEEVIEIYEDSSCWKITQIYKWNLNSNNAPLLTVSPTPYTDESPKTAPSHFHQQGLI